MSRRRFAINTTSESIIKLFEITLQFSGYKVVRTCTIRECYFSPNPIYESSYGGRFGYSNIAEQNESFIRFGFDEANHFRCGFQNMPLGYIYAPDGSTNVSREQLTYQYITVSGLTEYKGSGYNEYNNTESILTSMCMYINIDTTIQISWRSGYDPAYVANSINVYCTSDCEILRYQTPY